MADKRISTELVIKAVDQYSATIKDMSGVTGRFAEKVRSNMGHLQGLRGPLRMIEDYKAAQSTFDKSAIALERSRERVAELRREMRATSNPTKKMAQDFDRAQRAAERLRLAHDKNGTELTGLRGKLRFAGVNTGDLANQQRRLTSSLDTSSAAFARQTDRMQRFKVMQDRITAGRERMDRALARSANLSFVGNAAAGVGRRVLEKTGGVATRSGDQQEAFTNFQSLTGADDDRMSQLRNELGALRGVTNQSVDEMLAGLEVLVGKGMDLEAALGALPATALAAFGTGTSSDEMGGAGFALYDNLGVSPEDLKKAYDIMAMGGKEGGFELTAMAKSFPEITAGARALRMEGLSSVAELTAALQISMKSAGSESQAATNLSNFLGKLTSPATVRKFADAGISIEEELQKAMDRGVSPMEHMLGVIAEHTDGDALKLGTLFEDKQVLDFLRAMIPNMEEYARIRDTAFNADGTIDEDVSRKLRDFNAQKGQLGESLSTLFTLSPDMLLTLTQMMERADAFVEKLILWKAENPKFAKGIFLGAAALGAMAVAGGALLTVASGVMGTMAVLRFGLTGLSAGAAFAAGDLSRLGGGIDGIGRSRMRLHRPSFANHIADFANFRGNAAAQMTMLERQHNNSMRRISQQRRGLMLKGALAGGLTYLAMRQVPENPEERKEFQEANVRSMDTGFRATPGISHLMEGYEKTFEWVHGYRPPVEEALLPDDAGVRSAARTVQGYAGQDNLPTPDRLGELQGKASELRAEISALRSDIEGFGTPTDAFSFAQNQTSKSQLSALVHDLDAVEKQMSEHEGSAEALKQALQVLSVTSVSPEINTESIDAALVRVQALAQAVRSASSGGSTASTGPVEVQERATGGPFGTRPLLVGERGPELYFPNRSGFIATNQQTERLQRSAQRIRTAGLAGLAAASVAVAPQAALASSHDVSGGASGKSMSARVEIGSIHIVAPSGVSDPEGLVDLIETRLGERISATFAASFSD